MHSSSHSHLQAPLIARHLRIGAISGNLRLMPPLDLPTLIVADAAAFREWLEANTHRTEGAWLVLAKKNMMGPTTLTYAEALEEALCQGWIDGQRRSRDATTFSQRFTPRRRTSQWSKRNVGIAERLIADGRMRPCCLVLSTPQTATRCCTASRRRSATTHALGGLRNW